MVKIKAESCGLEGIMIDGYATRLEKLQNMQNLKKMQEKGLISDYKKIRTKFARHFYADNLTENQHFLFFRGLISELMIRFCPYMKKIGHITCHSTEYTLGKNTNSLAEIILYNRKRRWGFYLPLLQKEYENDKAQGKYPYIQFVNIFSKIPEQNCGKIEDCFNNWSTTLRFIPKSKKDYVDYKAFRHIWSDILRDIIIGVRKYGSVINASTGQYIEECNLSLS